MKNYTWKAMKAMKAIGGKERTSYPSKNPTKGTLTWKQLTKAFDSVVKAERKEKARLKKEGSKLAGYIGGIPLYANKKVPKGEIWIRSDNDFKKFVISDL